MKKNKQDILLTYCTFLFILQHSTGNLLTDNKLIENAVYATNKYYKQQFVTSVLWTRSNPEGANEFLSKYCGTVVATPLFDDDNVFIRNINKLFGFQQTVLFTSEAQSFKKFMKLTHENLGFPIRLIMIFEKSVRERAELTPFFEIAWQYNLVDIVIMYRNYNGAIIFLTYFPYRAGDCGNYMPVKLASSNNIFPDKFKNFNACSMRVSAVQFLPYVDLKIADGNVNKLVGYDGLILKFMAKKLNATLVIKDASGKGGVGTSYANGTATGAISDLTSGKADIVIPAGILSYDRYSVTQITQLYSAPDVRWVGPRQREIKNWFKLLHYFSNSVSLLLFLAATMFVIVVILIRRQKLHREKKSSGISFQAYALLLGQMARYETRLALLNNLFLLWIWFCFIIRIDYQGDLVGSLQHPSLEPPFASLEDAIQRLDNYGGVVIFQEYYKNTPIEKGYKVLPLPNLSSTVDSIVHGERFLLAIDSFLVRHLRSSVQILDEQISTGSTCYFIRRGWPAANTVASLFSQLVEFGFIFNFLRPIVKTQTKTIIEEVARPLNMTMLASCFYGLSFMCGVCFVIFIIEIVYYKYACKYNKEEISANIIVKSL